MSTAVGRFKLIAGRHVTWMPGSRPLTQEEIAQGKKREEKRYTVGDIIESTIDLVDRYGSAKFERVQNFHHSQPSSPDPTQGSLTVANTLRQVWKFEELNGMSVSDLRALASEEAIDLKGAKSKEDIIKVILN